MSESDRASFAADDVEFVVEISRCRAPLHRSTTEALRPAADVELYSSTALQSALHLYSSIALYTLHPLHPPSGLWHLSSVVAFRTRARRATRVAPRGHEPSAIRTRSQKLLARTAADSATAAAAAEHSRRLVPHMLPPCGCCRRAWRSAVLQGSADSILPRILLPPRLGTRM